MNALIPSVLLQSPVFVSSLDIIGNPGNVIVSLYNSLVNIVFNPWQALQNGEGLLSVLQSMTKSSFMFVQTLVGSLLQSISSISANLSRNILRLNSDEDGKKKTTIQMFNQSISD